METVRRLAFWFVLIPLGLLLIAFALANRSHVFLSLIPLPGFDGTFELPLFLIVFLCVLAGALLGSFITWNAQRPWRALSRRQSGEIDLLREEIGRLKTGAPAQPSRQDWHILPPL